MRRRTPWPGRWMMRQCRPHCVPPSKPCLPVPAMNWSFGSGWVRHTLESAAWGLLTTDSFEEAVVQVVNLGNDADTAGAVVGALAGAAYGLAGIPARWREALRGEWPLRSGHIWRAGDLVTLADQLVDCPTHD
ncbi:MAG: ADP-ribosylglycohydrolase family protein [Chloroflexi bacterium]|nr:ADP-ribosylglycohydrolase family protein [Chloroflexota bacterium]